MVAARAGTGATRLPPDSQTVEATARRSGRTMPAAIKVIPTGTSAPPWPMSISRRSPRAVGAIKQAWYRHDVLASATSG
jgi:hypothetical protein